jgi:hypothetical protein
MKVSFYFTALVFKANHPNGKNSNTMRYLATLWCFIILITSLAPKDGMAQARTVASSGNWDATTTWVGGNIADVITETVSIPTNIGVVTVVANTAFTVGEVTMVNGNTLSVAGALTIGSSSSSANFICANSDAILVSPTGSIIIWGSLEVRNNLVLTIDGDLIVKGDVILANGATLTINGSVQIDGDFSAGSGSTLTINGTGSFGVAGFFNSIGIDITIAAGGSLYAGEGFDVSNNSTISGDGTGSYGGDCTGPTEFCNGTILPVELIRFKSYFDSDGVLLSWASASELNSDYYSIERSEDGKTFYEIGKVMGNGTSNTIHEYEYKDKLPIKSNFEYYRLKQVDYDGGYEYSVILVEFFEDALANSYEIYPNPATSIIKMSSSRPFPNMQMINSKGQTIAILSAENSVTSFDISDLPSGIYYLHFSTAQGSNVQKLIIK